MNCVKCRTICKDFLKEVKTHLGLRVEKEFLIKERLRGKNILGRRNQHGQNQKGSDTARWIVMSVLSLLSFFSLILQFLRSPFYRAIFPLKERSWRDWNIILVTLSPPKSFKSTIKISHWYWLLICWCLWEFYISIKCQTCNREHENEQGLSFPSF